MRQLFLLLILTSHAGDSEAQVYKWVDENGTVHFSDLPPPGDPAEEVELARQPSEQSLQQAREDAARRLQNQRADSDARRETEESRRLEKEEGEQQAAEMQIRCTYARQQLRVFLGLVQASETALLTIDIDIDFARRRLGGSSLQMS